jgi:hypothetical protein
MDGFYFYYIIDYMKSSESNINRREFLKYSTAAAAAITVVPSSVLGGDSAVPPSERITFALIGCGTQGIRELPGMISSKRIQFVAVCDPNRESYDYIDWSRDGLRRDVANLLNKLDWRSNAPGIPGGREVVKEIIELYYGNKKESGKYSGCNSYADFRELLEKEKDLNAVKIMTPDHLHATIAVAALKKGKRVMMHKPIANRVAEGRTVIETARKTGIPTHFLPANVGPQISLALKLVKSGAIGRLKEIHNWSNRPVWPQYTKLPEDKPPIPPGFDWDLWLGPSLPRPYHPHYTHAVFRGWYEFGGGAIADMGHYSLWRVFQELQLDPPLMVESAPTHVCEIQNLVSRKIVNDYSFPLACTVRFRFAKKGDRPEVDLFWYDGGVKPATPEELISYNQELPPEGLMFIGTGGIIIGGFTGENLRMITNGKIQPVDKSVADSTPLPSGYVGWEEAFMGKGKSYGDFTLALAITDAFNLAAVSLRMGGRRLLWDATAMKITNLPDANKYLTREYRKGWELTI